MNVARHKRSGLAHLIAEDGLATVCGKLLHRAKFTVGDGEPACRRCLHSTIPARTGASDGLPGSGRTSEPVGGSRTSEPFMRSRP